MMSRPTTRLLLRRLTRLPFVSRGFATAATTKTTTMTTTTTTRTTRSAGGTVVGRLRRHGNNTCLRYYATAMTTTTPWRENNDGDTVATSPRLRRRDERPRSTRQRRMHRGRLASPSAHLLSTSTATAEATETTTTTTTSAKDSKEEKREQGEEQRLYMWGTDTGGSLLKVKEMRDEEIIDTPTLIEDWRDTMTMTTTRKDGEGGGGGSPRIESIVCGPTDTAWILSDGTCYVSGENKSGQLGRGDKDAVKEPSELLLPKYEGDGENEEERTVKQISLGPSMAAVVDDRGDLYTCGLGGSTFQGVGMLGHGNDISHSVPTLVESLVEDDCRVREVRVGDSHLTVLTEGGEVLSCGAGSYGRLGNFDTVDQLYLEPVEVLTPDHNVETIAGGKSFTLALARDPGTNMGVIYGWGRNHKGQLGTGFGLAVDMYAMSSVPEPIESDELIGRNVLKVAAGHSHAACITDGGELFYWGMSLHLEPVRVFDLLHTQVVDVACGEDYTLALDIEGNLYSFGTSGKTGVLGQGNRVKNLNQPTLMEAFQDEKIISISAGWKHAACLTVPK